MAKTTKIVLKGLRASYPHLFTKDQMADKYTCTFIIDKKNPQLAEFRQVILAAVNDCKATNPGKPCKNQVLRDGDVEKPEDAAFAGKLFFKASTSSATIKRSVYKRNDYGEVVEIDDESEFYGGCNCQASLAVSWYEFQGAYGVHCLLNGVCREEGGEPFGSNGCSASDFESDDMPEDFM